ncbi:MAG: SCO family protein [Pseudomonadota bacterium]
MTRQKALPLISLAVVAALLVWSLFFWKSETTTTAPGQPSGGDFTLQSANGPISLKGLRGKVVLLYFGYTSCPDICPTSLTMMRIALSQLSEKELAQIQGIFVSVDPQRDTPERLAEYSNHFHPSISGVTGTDEQVAKVAKQYGAIYQVAEGDSAMGYTVDHSSVTYVIDQQGRLTSTLPHGALPKSILQEIRSLLNKI